MERVFLLVYLYVFVLYFGTSGAYVSEPTLCSRSKCIARRQYGKTCYPQKRTIAIREHIFIDMTLEFGVLENRLGKFKYIEGVDYRYAYSIDVSTNLGEKPNQRRNASTLQIDSVVSLSFTSPCEGLLKLSASSVSPNRLAYDSEFPDRAGAEFQKSLEQYSLRFAFQDGEIQEVCPNPEEPVWVLNIKKGILSMFQNTMKRFDVDHSSRELDVNGICKTEYKLYEARKTSLIVKKTKDISTCTNRYKYLSVLQSMSYKSPFSSNSDSFREPLLKSWNECEIMIDHNIYVEVRCAESQLLKPLSNGIKTGARTDTRTSIKLIEELSEFVTEEDGGDEDFSLSRRVNLLYDHAISQKPTHGELRASRECLKNMCRMGAGEEIQQEFSEIFTKFIHSTRLLNYASLSQLLYRANSICRTARKHIVNSLPYIGSNAALRVQKDLIIRKQVPLDKVKNWVTGFSLISRPDKDTLSALAPLLAHQEKISDSQFDLSYSAVVHAFCRTVNNDCLRVEPVTMFLRQIELKIKNGCTKERHSPLQIKQTLEALKSIGNMGVETEALRDNLKDCIEGAGGYLTMETRIAAIDAHRRLPSCEKTRDSYFLNLYRNATQDTELRIASYLQVMRCPDYNVIKLIKHTLKEEEVNQVGSFVWSHLKNLLKSSSPSRIEIQSLLTDRDLGIKFNSDFRKFSKNYESSFFSDEYNLGTNYETNLIFSPSSYIPKTATVNATVDVFGESVNAFEIAVRFEGMEYYAEKFFGPEGPLSNEKVSSLFGNFLRSLRSAKNENEDYNGKVKRLPNVIEDNFDHPRISLALKVFGNDLQYIVLNGDKEIRETLATIDPWAKFKEILSGKEIRYEKNSMFLDSSYVVPTSTGLPLHLGLSGSAACNFKLSGSLDSKRLASSGEMEIIGNIMPSVSIDITGTMVIDAFYKSAGIKLKSNVYSSGAVQGHLNVKGTQLVSLNLGLPNDKIEVFSILTDVLFISTNGANSEEIPVGLIVAGRSSKNFKQSNLVPVVSNRTCSWSSLDRIIGLKLCTDYQFSNVTKNPDASYFILNGPSLFKVSLIKADPTAKSYLLEYRWQKIENQSIIKVAFDTPGSKIKRELSAQISFDPNTRNVSVILKAAGSLLIAKGTYRKTDDETSIDLGLDVNGTKHLNASIGYTRTDGHYGYNYNPKLYLAINNERVAELSGTIRTSEKSNVSQSDIDLLFVTKKVWSRIVGYIMRRNASVAANIKLDYQLEGPQASVPPKKETVLVEVSLGDRSQNTLTEKAANLKLVSSAYPHLNIDLIAWYRQALGHLEIHTEINSSPHLKDDGHKLTIELVLTNSRTYLQKESSRISAYIAITKPIQKLDIKVGIYHLTSGPETKTHGLIRYASGKEIMLILKIKMPRGSMLDVEAHVNLTIPTFNPLLIDIDIKERARNDYDLNLAGTWFSGHNITARGTYVDRSTLSITHHTMKLLLKSPSFLNDVITNCKIYLDASDVKIDLQIEQLDKQTNPIDIKTDLQIEQSNQNKYAIVIKHTSLTSTKFLSYLECRYKSNLYTFTAKVDKERETRVEIHLDNWRDVHFIARAIDEPHKTEAGIEIKWDANRDPDLKFATTFQLLRYSGSNEKNITTSIMITYPGRLVNGVWLLALRGHNNYLSDVRLQWSSTRFIQLTIDTDYNMEPSDRIFKIESQLLSPFESWKKTSLNARYQQTNNAITASGSVYWQDSQHVVIDISGDTKENDSTLEWRANCGLVSTIHAIKWIHGNITHKQINDRSADTHLWITYYPDKLFDVKSSWELTKVKDGSFNITGTLNMKSPLASYERCDVTCSFKFTPDWKICGGAYVDLDKRKYTGDLVGDLAKLRESMIQFNLTTPIERFSTLHGRLGFSETNKHVVAKIDGPHGTVGIEGLCQLFTQGSDFHLKLQVATPIDLLKRSLLVAKLNRKEADFRIGYNNYTAGFTGVWRYLNLTDFHYTYIVYTPIQGFEKCGIVTKLVIDGGPEASKKRIDTEFSLRLSDTKIGITARGGPKPPPFIIPKTQETTKNSTVDDYVYEDDEDEIEEKLYWQGQTLIDLAVFSTIVGDLDIDQEESLYKILASLKIPPGVIRLDDRFYMRDVLSMRNNLKIDTPFEFGSEITSTYIFDFDVDENISVIGTDFRIKNQSDWIEAGYHINHKILILDDLKTHVTTFKIKTPFRFLLYIDGNVNVEIEENNYKMIADVNGEDYRFDFSGSFETDDGFLDSMMIVKINSPRFVIPKTKILVKKDLMSKEKQIELGVEIYEPVLKVFNLQGVWQMEGNNYLNASLGLKSPIEMVENFQLNVFHVNSISNNDSAKLDLEFVHRSIDKYKLIGDYKENTVSVKAITPIRNYENVELLGNVFKVSEGSYRFDGDLTNDRTSNTYKVSGEFTTVNKTITTLKATIIPGKNSLLRRSLGLNFNREAFGFKFWTENSTIDASLRISFINMFNWNADAKIHSADQRQVDYELTTFANTQANGNLSVHLLGKTPWKSLEIITIDGNMLLSKLAGSVQTKHRFNKDSSNFELKWNLLWMQDIFAKLVFNYEIENTKKHLDTQIFYKNPKETFRNLNTGFDIIIDHELWRFGSNVTVGYIDKGNIDAILRVTLPPPDKDSHTILLSYHGQKEYDDIKYAVGYSTELSQLSYASDGSLKRSPRDINGHLRVTWGLSSTQTINNLFNATLQNKEISFDYSLITPKFPQEETFVLRLNYNATSVLHNVVNANVYYPSTNQVGSARILYSGITNVNGTVNVTTLLPGYRYVGCNFIVFTTLKRNKRFIEGFWPGNTAYLNSDYTYNSERLDSSLEGILRVEVPLNTRHIGYLTYGYKKRPQITTGHSELTYNGDKIVEGKYNLKSESRAGFEKDRIEITIQNSLKPLGIIYTNQYEYSAGNEGTNYPTVELKRVYIYKLDNSTEFNVTGESRIRTTHGGQDIDLQAIHFNRTVKLRTDYKILSGEFDHNSHLSLAEDAWASYHVNILNKTTDGVENQFLILNFAYPRRNFTLDASYRINSSDISSEAKLEWDKDKDHPRTIGAGFDWNQIMTPRFEGEQQAVLSFKHPSFKKDVTFTVKLDKRDPKDLLNITSVLDYSTIPEKLLVLSGRIHDDSNWPSDRRYSYEIVGHHPITYLDLNVKGSLYKHAFVFVEIGNYAKYKRSYLPIENGQLYAYVNLPKYEIELRRENKDTVKYLKTRYYPTYPEYVINGSMIYTPDINATGHFMLNIDEQLTSLMVNYTPDAIESLRMYGKIPDARNAVFDIWRTYDQDLIVSDVAFYLRLNHSRLVTSTLKWRPDLKADVTNTIKSTFNAAYESIGSDADYWKQYIRSESANAVTDIWNNAQEEITEFLEDLNDLKELQTDLKDLQLYLNDSYNANEFYVKDLVSFGSYMLDELSLKSHIQSLPNIFNEIWDIMGESGLAIRNSLIWAIEAIKSSYAKLSEIVSLIMKGDSMTQIVAIVEKIVEQYDNFVKDLHVSFIKYMENLWHKMSLAASNQWSKFLRYVEPMFIKVLHYCETVLWKASKEVLDFLYDRRNEIITSPYFDRFTNFTQDVDKIYKDIKTHDVVTNVRKYSGIIIQFIKERYFSIVPFGKELKNVIDEIIGELQELTKLPSVRYTIEKGRQLYDKVKYLYDYFEVGKQINHAIRLIQLKITDISQTALQAENRYREAKTKFIFSPQNGLLCLEQKLPMSWHAFNQTPEFQEIAEYRAIADVRSYFVTSNMTFWTLYYQYKPYTEPSSWLPPFKAQAMIGGGQHYMTFDGHYYEFSGECTYLLAQDFIKHQFAVLVKYNVDGGESNHQIIVLIGGKAIQINVFKNSVRLLDSEVGLQLPAHLGNGEAYVYQEETIVVVESPRKLFRLECNMKFDLCLLELSGWYYGKTAGLFGTMSNEQTDDFLSSNGMIANDIGSFARSWSLDKAQCTSVMNRAFIKSPKAARLQICDDLFLNKSSEFNSCFNIINPSSYRTMCLNSRTEKEACTVAVSYIQVCIFHDTYLRIPDKCTRCSLTNGTEVREGEFRTLEGNSVPKSSDIVFIIEAKICNEDIKKNASLEQLISQLKTEFNELQLNDLRWSLVTFGGDGVYDQPRSLVINGETFTTDHKHFLTYFEHIPIGNGNQDIFAALRYASRLGFRTGVSKTFILLPCSHCDPQNQTLDYSVLHQVLLEHDTTLHILMNADFELEKERDGKIFYGLDAKTSYTKTDARELKGDKDLRRQVKLSKSILGYCTPLALETNGTVFSGKKLRYEKPVAIKKIANVFSKRVAAGAAPSICQHCECVSDANGLTKMECIPCVYPTPVTINYEGFNEEESLAVLQPFDFDYPQPDQEIE